MTTPEVRTISRGGSRYYIHPVTQEKAVGVTSVVGMLPKDFLKWWAAKMVAEEAVDNFGALASLVASGQRDGAVDWLKRAHLRNTGEASIRGTDIHTLTEAIDEKGGIPKGTPKAHLGYARGYIAFREETEAEIMEVETTVWNSTHGYSGTLDRIVRIPESAFANMDAPPSWYEGEKPIIADVKTTRSGIHAEVALQLSAYKAAEEKMAPQADGSFAPEPWMPLQEHGLVIWLRPDEWKLVPVFCGAPIFDIFVSLMDTFHWEKELKDSVLLPALAGQTWEESAIVSLEKIIDKLGGK
jgi:hypothetical protein